MQSFSFQYTTHLCAFNIRKDRKFPDKRRCAIWSNYSERKGPGVPSVPLGLNLIMLAQRSFLQVTISYIRLQTPFISPIQCPMRNHPPAFIRCVRDRYTDWTTNTDKLDDFAIRLMMDDNSRSPLCSRSGSFTPIRQKKCFRVQNENGVKMVSEHIV